MTGTIIFIGIILICCLFVAFGNSSAPATTSCIENENLKKYTHVLMEDSTNNELYDVLKSIFESGDTYEEYAQKNNIENSVVVFDKFQEQIDSITNEHDRDILDAMNDELRCRGMFITNGKGLIMHPREKCYYRGVNAVVHTITKLMKNISYSGFKYNKNLFRSGNMLITSNDIVGWKEYTRGTMYVTNQRVVIIGIDNKVKSIPLGQIISYANYENNGILFQIANGNPIIFNLPMDGVFHFNTQFGTLFEDDICPCLLALDKAFEERNK